MRVGIVGLGRLGSGIIARLRDRGFETVGYDRDPSRTEVGALSELVDLLDERPRVVWTLLPAGAATSGVVEELADLLAPGDVIVDGGNADFRDSVWRSAMLAGRDISFVDAGVSGGVRGGTSGYCLMVGGSSGVIDRVRPVLEALATEGGLAHLGPVGSGHFASMVHTALEHSLMQAYAEGYDLLAAADLDIDVRAAFEAWRHGSVVRSWLLDVLARALEDDPQLERVVGHAKGSRLGGSAVREAVRLAVPVPALSAALHARLASQRQSSAATKVLAALNQQFDDRGVREPE